MRIKMMFPLILILSLFASSMVISGCATPNTNSDVSAPFVTQQPVVNTLQGIVMIGHTMEAIPPILDAFYNSGKISKDQYNNNILPVYNRALGAFMLLKEAAASAIAVGMDPKDSQSYLNAFNNFMLNQNLLNNILLVNGIDPAVLQQPVVKGE